MRKPHRGAQYQAPPSVLSDLMHRHGFPVRILAPQLGGSGPPAPAIISITWPDAPSAGLARRCSRDS